jgi:hypothetical protein
MRNVIRQTTPPVIVTVSMPVQDRLGFIRRSATEVFVKTSDIDVYRIVKEYESNSFSISTLQSTEVDRHSWIDMRQIVGLHNCSGIRSPKQIVQMAVEISKGKDVLQDSGLPNIKLVKTEDNDTVLFDGHHSLLAYLLVGRRFLHEVPHLIVSHTNGGIHNKDVLVFFGNHANSISPDSWRNYVINWQALPGEQLCTREEHNMGELLDAIQSELETCTSRSNPSPGRCDGKRTPRLRITAPAEGSPARPRWPSKSA